MSLETYQKKRNFKRSPEPRPGKVKDSKKGVHAKYMIHEHFASHHHYDLRLEVDGVLKSWAIPKTPSAKESTKRLAIEVEDHPLSYGEFEGTIPKGEYGAGRVLIWDQGTWSGWDEDAYKKGKIELDLKGQKLSGRWLLIKADFRGEKKQNNQWLFFKAPEKDN